MSDGILLENIEKNELKKSAPLKYTFVGNDNFEWKVRYTFMDTSSYDNQLILY